MKRKIQAAAEAVREKIRLKVRKLTEGLRPLQKKERALLAAAGAAGGALVGWIFYRSLWALLPAAVGTAILPFWGRRELDEREKQRKEAELVELLRRFSGALRSGLSPENALLRCVKEEERSLFPLLGPMWERLEAKLGNRLSPEAALLSFAQESGLEEMKQLAGVAEICRKEGGSLSQAVAEAAELLREKANLRAETRLLLSGRRTEQRILNLMPFAMLLLLSLMSPGYFEVMYTSTAGRIIMSLCLLVMLMSLWLSKKLSDPGELS